MALVVRCPICGCIYQVTPEDLEADNGRLRCGICQTRFDASETLRKVDDDVLDGLLCPRTESRRDAGCSARRGAPCSFFRFSRVRTVHAERRSGRKAPRFQPSEFTFPETRLSHHSDRRETG